MEKYRPYLLVILACLMVGKIGITVNHTHVFSGESKHSICMNHSVENRTTCLGYDRPFKVELTHHVDK